MSLGQFTDMQYHSTRSAASTLENNPRTVLQKLFQHTSLAPENSPPLRINTAQVIHHSATVPGGHKSPGQLAAYGEILLRRENAKVFLRRVTLTYLFLGIRAFQSLQTPETATSSI